MRELAAPQCTSSSAGCRARGTGPAGAHLYNSCVQFCRTAVGAFTARSTCSTSSFLLPARASARSATVAASDRSGRGGGHAVWRRRQSVCYDVRFPGLYRRLVARGGPALGRAGGVHLYQQDHWHVLLRARAIENQCFVLAPARAGAAQREPARPTGQRLWTRGAPFSPRLPGRRGGGGIDLDLRSSGSEPSCRRCTNSGGSRRYR